ncbi:DUF7115 domain-containing protein [Natronobeatus ordinarius]|uniref:DUF7115 domain-containing protein n=1 Tax=Natronobeatus ordinarius TaxID=2963433 RepID=UPI0020CD6E84|nr:hypothetical protein [Natronobeatus ordinarius]
MSVPGIVQSTLDGEEVASSVSLGGEDELFITPSRSIIYRAEGLLSDESIDEFPHEADRLTLSEGRRKTRLSLEYPLEGTREFTIPSSRTDAVLHPVLAGVLSGNGITEAGETVQQTYQFSELTLIVTSERLVKHIGEAVWDDDYEEYHFDDVTNLSFEEGSVATQIVLEVGGRQQRIKAPNEQATDVRNRLEYALFEYHDVHSLEELNDHLGAEAESEADSREDPAMAFGDGVEPLGSSAAEAEDGTDATDAVLPDDPLTGTSTTGGAADSSDVDAGSAALAGSSGVGTAGDASETATTVSSGEEFENSGFEPASPRTDPELLERLESLEETVASQTDLLERQQETIEQLIEELRLGR